MTQIQLTTIFLWANHQGLDYFESMDFNLFRMKPESLAFMKEHQMLPLRIQKKLKRWTPSVESSPSQLLVSLDEFQFWDYHYRNESSHSMPVQLTIENADITLWLDTLTDFGMSILRMIKTIESVDIHYVMSLPDRSFPIWIQIRSAAPTRIHLGSSTTMNPKKDPPYWKHQVQMNQGFQQILHPFVEHTIYFNKAEYVSYVYKESYQKSMNWINCIEFQESIDQYSD